MTHEMHLQHTYEHFFTKNVFNTLLLTYDPSFPLYCSDPTVKLLEGPKNYMYCTFHEFWGSLLFRLCFTCCCLYQPRLQIVI